MTKNVTNYDYTHDDSCHKSDTSHSDTSHLELNDKSRNYNYNYTFINKYKPSNSREIIGHKLHIQTIKKTISSYKGKPLLIFGPSGVGKTSAIHAIAKELKLELVEVNASDTRNTESLEQKIIPAIRQQSLFSANKLILIDEIDGLAGNEDRGGLNTILKIIAESKYPVVLTANSVEDTKLNSLKKQCVLIEFKPLSFLEVLNHLKNVCNSEGISFDEDALVYIARSSGGDLRAALNDLQNIASEKKNIFKKDVEQLAYREREESILNALLKIFKTKSVDVALGVYENVDEDLDKIFLWLDENLPKEYTNIEDLSKAYDVMSLADVYFGRIRRWQYYRYYVYIYDLLSVGIALSKKEKNHNFVSYSPTTRILKIWIANQKNSKKREIARKISLKTHASTKRIITDMPFIKFIIKNSDEKFLSSFVKEFNLEDEEIDWLRK